MPSTAASFTLASIGLFLVRRGLRAPVDRAPTRIVDDIHEGIAVVLVHALRGARGTGK